MLLYSSGIFSSDLYRDTSVYRYYVCVFQAFVVMDIIADTAHHAGRSAPNPSRGAALSGGDPWVVQENSAK